MALLGLAAVAAASATAQPLPAPVPAAPAVTPPGAVPYSLGSFSKIVGYLPVDGLPDGLLLNPPPPAPGSAAQARDDEDARRAVALRGTPRWDLAKRDADFFSAASTGAFSCAAGLAIGPATTPKLDAFLRRVGHDLGLSTRVTKARYQRARPFMVNGQPECTPDLEAVLRKDGSYPSGHSAIGYGWGLVLAELLPARAAALVARGRAFGDSRMICNVHWRSDVEEGRIEAATLIARLHAEPAFRADLEAARAEIGTVPHDPDPAGCAAEATALAVK